MVFRFCQLCSFGCIFDKCDREYRIPGQDAFLAFLYNAFAVDVEKNCGMIINEKITGQKREY